MTCLTSHTYNTLFLLFSNLLPFVSIFTCVTKISSLLATLLYENQQGIILSYIHVIQSLRPTFEYNPDGDIEGMFLPLISRSVNPVCFNISPLYQIISLHQLHQLSYYRPHFKRELC